MALADIDADAGRAQALNAVVEDTPRARDASLCTSLSMSAMGGEADMPGPRFKVGS